MSAPPFLVVGLDLSLTSTGIAFADGGQGRLTTNSEGPGRIETIRRHVMAQIPLDVELVVIEGYSYGTFARYIREIAELGGVIRNALWRERLPYLDVAPSALKKVATGSGKATKYEVIKAAEKKLAYEGSSDDEADALWLRAIGLELLGHSSCVWNKAQTEALDALKRIAPYIAPPTEVSP